MIQDVATNPSRQRRNNLPFQNESRLSSIAMEPCPLGALCRHNAVHREHTEKGQEHDQERGDRRKRAGRERGYPRYVTQGGEVVDAREAHNLPPGVLLLALVGLGPLHLLDALLEKPAPEPLAELSLRNRGLSHYDTAPAPWAGVDRRAWVGRYPFMVSLQSIRYRRSRGQVRTGSPASGAAQRLGDEFGDLGRVRRRPDVGLPQGLALCLGGALSAGYNAPGVAHGLALGGGEARDVGDDRGAHLALDVLGGELLGVAPDLTYHHGAFGLRVRLKQAQDLDKVRPYDGVAPDAHGGALPDTPLRELVDDLVGQSPATADDADVARHENVARHYGNVRLLRREHARAVRPDERGVLVLDVAGHPHHVVDGDALRDAADGREPAVERLEDRIRR